MQADNPNEVEVDRALLSRPVLSASRAKMPLDLMPEIKLQDDMLKVPVKIENVI